MTPQAEGETPSRVRVTNWSVPSDRLLLKAHCDSTDNDEVKLTGVECQTQTWELMSGSTMEYLTNLYLRRSRLPCRLSILQTSSVILTPLALRGAETPSQSTSKRVVSSEATIQTPESLTDSSKPQAIASQTSNPAPKPALLALIFDTRHPLPRLQ